MTSDVVLTAALRNNLLSLQTTQSLIDTTQFRLATGRKVNSALDNPQSFFAAQALNNRASDLTRLLDSIGQSIQTIQAADNGVTALTTLVEQADAIANDARDALAQGQAEAKVVGDKDLSGIDDLEALTGITDTDTLTFSVTDENGEQIDIGTNFGGAVAATAVITINDNDSIEDLINEINNIYLSDEAAAPLAQGDQAFEASLNASGQLQIRTLNGGDFRVVFAGGGGAGDTDAEDLALAEALGLGGVVTSAGDQTNAGNTSIEFTAISDVALRSFELHYDDDNNANTANVVAVRSTLLSDLELSDTTALFANIDSADDEYLIGINGGTREVIELFDGNNAVTLQEFIDSINTNDALNGLISAEFDDDTGVLSIRAVDASVENIQIGVENVVTANFGFGLVDDPNAAGLTGPGANVAFLENINIGAAAGQLADLEGEYESVRQQITELVTNGDTGYRGTNLLNGDDLLTVFNEQRTSTLTTTGQTFTADGLGIAAADFSRTDSVDQALAQVRSALETIRSFGSSLANDLTVIQTRETFTQNTISTLTEGADKLTIADQNEEGAKLLALQVRQQLGVTSLALASQSQQSILRLF